jgi:hypothetical protein
VSLPVAKNAMRRAIEALFYRPLNQKEKDLIWKYFKSRCAYCNKRIDRAHRHGHMDHLDCSAFGGGNYIRNRVLACKECNGNEKREHNWRKFLKSKCGDAETFDRRKNSIIAWQKQFPPLTPTALTPKAELAKATLLRSIKIFERKFIRFRTLIRE